MSSLGNVFGIGSYLSSPKETQRRVLNKQKYLRILPKQIIILGEGSGGNSLQFVS